MASEIKYEFDRYDGRPGEPYREWRIALMNHCSTKSDESGSSWADHLMDIDMGGAGPGAPAFPIGAQRDKMVRLRLSRSKNTYGIIVKHISDPDLVKILATNHFGNGQHAFNYLNGLYDTPVRRQDLRELDRKWSDVNITSDVGINEDSIMNFAKLLSRLNGERPIANRHNDDELTEKLLESVADASRHFHEQAMTEYNALPGHRKFETAPGAGGIGGGSRDFLGCVDHYHRLWRSAVRSKVLTPMMPQRRAASSPVPRALSAKAFDGNMVKNVKGTFLASSRSQSPTSPAHTLYVLRQAGLDLERNTTTTSNFEEISPEEIAMAISGRYTEGFDLETCYDSDGRKSFDIICDCCRGVGHVRRQCPSPKQYRSFGYVIKLLELAKNKSEQWNRPSSDPGRGRRTPSRGQRPPPRDQPSRYQPAQKEVKFVSEVERARRGSGRVLPAKSGNVHTSRTATANFDPKCMPTVIGDYFEDELCVRSIQVAPSEDVGSIMKIIDAGLEKEAPEKGEADAVFATSVHGSAAALGWILKQTLKASILGIVTIFSIFLINSIWNCDTRPINSVKQSLAIVGKKEDTRQILKLCVDSGATSGCISVTRMNMMRITNTSPNAKVKVANGSILPVVAVGDLTLSNLSGFILESDGSRTPTTTDGTWHNMLIVEGLDPNTVLVSVKQMRDTDGIQTYFNNDNEAGISDCLKFPNGVYVPFSSDRFELTGSVINRAEEHNRDHAKSSKRPSMHVHAALCHAGTIRIQLSNVLIDGEKAVPLPKELICKGCTLGGTKITRRTGSSHHREKKVNEVPVTFYGQLVYSDTCTSFPKSFPHGYSGMINFCDAYSGERDFFFLVKPHDPEEVASALKEYHRKNQHRLQGEKIWTWKTDNGGEFRGEAVDGIGGIARELVNKREYSVANTDNCNPEAERAWGVIQRGIRACHAHADAPECLWPWAAAQCSQVYHHLASTVHKPPLSARDFLNPHLPPADLSWARTMYCDVLVALPERDVYSKVCHRTTQGCHLGYDSRRRGHFVYCPKEKRLGTYKVLKWMEDDFTFCKGISNDTPVEYHSLDDLQIGPATAALMPKLLRKGFHDNTAIQLIESVSDNGGAELIGVPGYKHLYESAWEGSHRLAWISESSPCEIVYAVKGTASTNGDFPTTLKEAASSPYWPLVKEALEEEIRGKFLENKAWDVVPRPENRHVVKSKWVLRFFQHDDGSISRVKARLVACGYSQIAGKDYTEVFAATLSATNLRIFCSLIAHLDWETDQLDAIKAFTQSDVDAEIYVEMPEGFEVKGHVLKLNKALEGIKQGANLWFKRNSDALTAVGFVASLAEPNLYIHQEFPIMVAVFVDDIIVGYDKAFLTEYLQIKEKYAQVIKIGSTDIKEVHKFCGVEISRDREKRTITLTQRSYINELAARYKGIASESYSPSGPTRASAEDFDRLKVGEDDAPNKVDTNEYMQMIGSILWVANMSRPDIAYHSSRLAMYSRCPTEDHRKFALSVIGYLVKTKDMGITYGGKLRVPIGMDDFPNGYVESLGLHTYYDSSWGKETSPFGGYVIMLNNGAIAWSSRKLRIVPDSTAEAETAVSSRAAKDTVAVRMILEDLRACVTGPTALLGDCKATKDIITKPGSTQRTRYFERATMLVKRLFMMHVIVPVLIRTDDMVADIFTKALPRDKLGKFREYMLNLDRHGYTMGALSGNARRIWKQLRSVV
jgi:hypothetical protein